jgi:hypothetical protein
MGLGDDFGKIRQVLECGSPLPLFVASPAVAKRQRTAALQDAVAPAKRLKMSKNSHFRPKPCLFGEKRVFFAKNGPPLSKKDAFFAISDVSETISQAWEMKKDASETISDASETVSDGSEMKTEASEMGKDGSETISEASEMISDA